MSQQQYEEILSLAECLRIPLTDLLSLAHLVAGDAPIRTIFDLSYDGSTELIGMLRELGRHSKDWDWLDRLVAA
jgi:hypothetical protein